MFSLIAPALRRSRDAGIPAWMGLVVPLLFIANYGFFTDQPSGFGLTVSFLRVIVPVHALVGLVCMLALVLLPTSARRVPLRRLGVLGIVTAAIGAIVALFMLVSVPFLMLTQVSNLLGRLGWDLWVLSPYLSGVLAALVLACAFTVRSWETVPREPVTLETVPPELETLRRTPARDRLPVIRLALAAVALAMIAAAVADPSSTENGFSPVVLVFKSLQTAMLYAIPLFGIALLLRRRWVWGAGCCLLFGLVLSTWLYDRWHTEQINAAARQVAAALPPLAPPESYPTTFFNDTGQLGRFKIPGVTRQIFRRQEAYAEIRWDGQRWSKAPPLTELPARYLILREGQQIWRHEAGRTYTDNQSLTLSMVADGVEQPNAELYSVSVTPPAWLPIATGAGWLQERSQSRGSRQTPATFVVDALSGSHPEQP